MRLDRVGVRRTLAALVALPLTVVAALTWAIVADASGRVERSEAGIAAIQRVWVGGIPVAVRGELVFYDVGRTPETAAMASVLGPRQEFLIAAIRQGVDDEIAAVRSMVVDPDLAAELDALEADLADVRRLHDAGEPTVDSLLGEVRDAADRLLDDASASTLLLHGGSTTGIVPYQELLLARTNEAQAAMRLVIRGIATDDERAAYVRLTTESDNRLELTVRTIGEGPGRELQSLVGQGSLDALRERVDALPEAEPARPVTADDVFGLILTTTADVETLFGHAVEYRDGVTAELEAERSDANRRLFLAAVGVPASLVMVAAATGLIGLRLMRRLQTVSMVADQVSGGELDVEPIDDGGNDGISRLARAIDGMTGTLSVVQRQLSALADERFDDESLDVEVPGSAGRDLRSAVGRVRSNTSRLREWADRDALTGLMNRRALERELVTSTTAPATARVLVFDLDGFKEVNDSLGHGAGDEVLVAVAERIVGLVRDDDLVARLGGDEFVVVTFGDSVDAADLADRLVTAVAEPIETSAGPGTVGASVGWTTTDGDEPFELVVRRADEAMYRAKRAGKGRVVRAGHAD